jgi:hypothetical protein
MKERILTGWNFRRLIYLLAGGFVIAQSVMAKEWVGILPGAFLASMSLFAFGCAAGHCVTKTDHNEKTQGNKEIQSLHSVKLK